MRILQVIHGYPMLYNAGSEVYTQTLSQGLAERHEVHVFTREEDSFAPDFRIRHDRDPDDPRITLHLVNNPRLKDRYRVDEIDERFAQILDLVRPDIVHVGHLNHLSTAMVGKATERKIPVVFTLHDYWLMCPRGQFMQMFSGDPEDLWAACDGQEDRSCAERCYARYFSGSADERDTDIAYWTNWVARRMRHVRDIAGMVDLFIAPSRYLLQRFHRDFGLPHEKLTYLDYGFARDRMAGRSRARGEPFTFGYIGTHIPAKGIHDLITAFGMMTGSARLRIWGRPRGQDTAALQALAAALPGDAPERIEWRGEYRNQDIVRDVLDHVDAIVVPSVWVENAPLVIHEAQQARVPVITANAGGMAEFVHHEVNGLLFRHRSPTSLADRMQRLADDPVLASRLGARGYLDDERGDIPGIEAHVRAIETLYHQVLRKKAPAFVGEDGPWRITFDTNPDTCNLRCIMCEEHSPHSPRQVERQEEGRPRRVMPFDLIERVVADAAPRGLREIIPSTMGEPLVYDDFEGIIGLCHRYGIKLNLTTNGTFPRLGATAWATKIVPIASDVKISWNGATAPTQESIMLGARWDKLLTDIRDFIAVRDSHAAAGGNRCRVTFQLTFMEANVEELADIVRLAADLGIDRVKGHHLWAHFPAIHEQSMRRSPQSIERWNRAVADAHAEADRHRRADGRKVLLNNIEPILSAPQTDVAPAARCPFLGQEAWVSAEGRFDPCCAPDAARRTLGEFGNLNDRSLMDIWTSAPYRTLVKGYRDRALCKGCLMRRSTAAEESLAEETAA